MKNNNIRLFSLFALALNINVCAQITISQGDLPSVNQVYEFYRYTDVLGSNAYAPTGANFNWNFKDLNQGILNTVEYVQPLFTDPLYYVDFTNPLNPPISNLAAATEDLGFAIPGGVIEDAFLFYHKTNDDFKALGFAAKLNGVPITARYDNPDILYKFPLQFLDSWITNSEFDINIPQTVYFREKRRRTVTVDGFGVLSLPGLELEVLRIKSESILNDSIFNFQFGFGTNLPARNEIEYIWLAKNKYIPVLRVLKRNSGGFGPGGNQETTDVFYQRGDLSVFENNFKSQPKIFPNPSNGFVNIEFLENHSFGEMSVKDLTGKVVFSSTLSNTSEIFQLNLSHLKSGVYFLNFRNDASQSVNQKLIIN